MGAVPAEPSGVCTAMADSGPGALETLGPPDEDEELPPATTRTPHTYKVYVISTHVVCTANESCAKRRIPPEVQFQGRTVMPPLRLREKCT